MTRYRTIVADPPWPYPSGFGSGDDRPHLQDRLKGATGGLITRKPLPYPSMTLDDIAALPLADLADARGCRLFLWTTSRYLSDACAILPGWGFTYKQLLVWDKRPNVNPLSGSVAATSAEFLIVAVRGKPKRMAVWKESIISARKPRAEHSRKPEVFLDIAMAVSPGPRLEMFARRARLGWHVWGNEVDSHVEMGA